MSAAPAALESSLDVGLALVVERRTRENILATLLAELLGSHPDQQIAILTRALHVQAHRHPDPCAFLALLCAQLQPKPRDS